MGSSLIDEVTEDQIAAWAQAAQAATAQGQVNQRIAALAHCSPDWFGLEIHLQKRRHFVWGITQHPFALMSVVKPFLLLYLLELYGTDQVFQWVGGMPSDAPFNDLNQLKADGGHPRNPMINSGALVLADHLPGTAPAADFCRWLNQLANCRLSLDSVMLKAVKTGRRDANLALLNYLAETGQIRHPETAIDSYERLCCLSGRLQDLARIGELLALKGPVAGAHRQAVNALMLTCGLYEASPDYAMKVGLPMKSGISGALLTTLPKRGVIVTYGPALNAQGNSVAGLAFVARMAQALNLSLFA